MGDCTLDAVQRRMRLRPGALRAVRVLELCPLLPVDAFGPIVGLGSESGAYKQLARLRSGGLADVHHEDLGFLLGDGGYGLWSITDLGRRALRCAGGGEVKWQPDRSAQSLAKRQLSLRIASYWLLAWSMVEARAHAQAVAVQAWECPWVAEFQPAEDDRCVRVRLPAAAYIVCEDAADSAPSSGRRLLLLPDLGTAPVARYREILRRVLTHIDNEHELLIATPDPHGRAMRATAWSALITRLARTAQLERPAVRIVSWSEVGARLGGSVTRALVGAQPHGTRPTPGGRSGRDQVLHLLGRHPLLTVRQLARLLGTPRVRIERSERELIELGLVRALDDTDLSASGHDVDALDSARLELVEVTTAGRRRLADMLGLDTPTASRYHGLMGGGRATAARRRWLLRTLAHTVGTNDVFVAFALAASKARRRGGNDELSEWRPAAACERQRCKPDGYGLYTRDGVGYAFLLEYDRGTESARKYASKFGAYYRYRDSGQAARDYNGFPTILFITTSVSAEDRIARQAYRAWFARGAEPLPVLLTTTQRISGHPEGIVGPIWRSPDEARGDVARRSYWLPSPCRPNEGRE